MAAPDGGPSGGTTGPRGRTGRAPGRCYTGQSRRPGAVAAGGPGGGDRLGQRAEGGPKAMSQLVVITFDDEEQAGRALQSIRQVERQGQLKLNDTAVVVKDKEGRVHTKNEVSSATETGAVIGGVIGGLLTF